MADVARTIKALTWVLRTAIDASIERCPDLTQVDAGDELKDLMAIRELIVDLGGRDPDIEKMGVELAHAHTAYA
jgi:hypothetical protein